PSSKAAITTAAPTRRQRIRGTPRRLSRLRPGATHPANRPDDGPGSGLGIKTMAHSNEPRGDYVIVGEICSGAVRLGLPGIVAASGLRRVRSRSRSERVSGDRPDDGNPLAGRV